MSKPNSCTELIQRIARMTSSPGGLDGCLMALQYGSPLAAAALIAAVKARAEKGVVSANLVDRAAGIVRAGGAVGEARTAMRLFGLLPMVSALLRLHPNPLKALLNAILSPSLSNFDLRNEKVFSTVRVCAYLGYYLGEHTAWLGKQGVLNLSPEQIGRATMFSIKAWSIDVVLTAIKLLFQLNGLRKRDAALKKQENGLKADEKSDVTAQRAQLTADWTTWETTALQYYGYLPLTLHWSLGGLWTNPLITAALGSMVAFGKIQSSWYAAKA